MSEEEFGYDARLPKDIREIFMLLSQDVAWLYFKWHFYLELYGADDNTRLLSRLAMSSFRIIEESLRSDMTMSICRLSDPPQTMGKDNLSLPTLVGKCSNDEAKGLLKHFLDTCGPVRQHRNRSVGHCDLKTAVKPSENPLPGISRSQVDDILSLASGTLNRIYQLHVDGALAFDHTIARDGADTLLYLLRQAEERLAERDSLQGGTA